MYIICFLFFLSVPRVLRINIFFSFSRLSLVLSCSRNPVKHSEKNQIHTATISENCLADLDAENGAYPPTQNGSIHPQLLLKWAWKEHKKRSISVHFCPKHPKSLKKNGAYPFSGFRITVQNRFFLKKRSIPVHLWKCNERSHRCLRPENGAYPFTFSSHRQRLF